MNIKLVCSNRYFEIDDSVKNYQFDDFIISKDKELLFRQFGEQEFISRVGLNAIPILELYPYFLSILDREYILSTVDVKSEERLSEKKLELLQFFIFCLWFVKDNSANTDQLYTYVRENQIVFSRTRTITFCNAKGEYSNTVFNMDDLNEAKDICFKIHNLRSIEVKRSEEANNIGKTNYNKIQAGDYNFIQYNSQNRIDRALLFLYLARGNSYLPLKIFFYIGIFESLFTTDNSEVSHKVTERITIYLSGNSDCKLNNFKAIKSAYDVRSKFVHGQLFDRKKIKTKDDLILLTEHIDNLTREVLKKIIKTDSSIFLQDDENLTKWFNMLVLCNNR